MSNKTKQIFIAAIISTVCVAITFAYFANLIFKEGVHLDEAITMLAKSNAKDSAQVRLGRLIKDTEADRLILNSHFFGSEGDSINFIGEIESLASALGLDLETETLDKVNFNKNDAIKTIFRFSGNKKQVVGFLRLMENTPLHSRVESFSLEQKGPDSWQGRLTMFITIKAI